MTGVFVRGRRGRFETETQRKRPHEDKAGTGRMWLQAQGKPETGRVREAPPTGHLEGARPCLHLHFGLLASRTGKIRFNRLSHSLW